MKVQIYGNWLAICFRSFLSVIWILKMVPLTEQKLPKSQRFITSENMYLKL